MPAVNSKSMRMPNRFAPYTRSHSLPPAPSTHENLEAADLPAAELAQLYKELQFTNETNTVTYTYCNILRRWKPWFHPRITYKNGSARLIAPAGLRGIKYHPPQCPHSQNFHRETKDTTMKLSRDPNGGYQFQCDGHNCQFIVKMAPWNGNLIVNEDDYNKRLDGIHAEDLEEEDSERNSSPSRSSSDEVASMLMASSQTSASYIAPACVPVMTTARPYLFEMSELTHRIDYDQDMVTRVLDDRCDNGVSDYPVADA
ncbi:hypothetical protein C8R46DRAFT_1027672 [Mycena filopes]|nr:hypothetical protein C8R46DRAFT_1027672 [Mycena filopes]